MVNQDKTNVSVFCNVLELPDDIIIFGIAVRFPWGCPYLLECVDYSQPGIGVFPKIIVQLCFQPGPHLPGTDGEVEIVRPFHAEHPGHSFLQSPLIVLQRQVQYPAAADRVAPDRKPGADMIGKLRHQEGFADLRRSGEKVSTGGQQAVDDRRPIGKGLVIQVVHGEGAEMGTVCVPQFFLHPPQDFLVILFPICYTAFSLVEWLPFICANRCVRGSHFFYLVHTSPLPSICKP